MITNQVISGKLYKAMLVRNKKEEFEREEKLDYLITMIEGMTLKLFIVIFEIRQQM